MEAMNTSHTSNDFKSLSALFINCSIKYDVTQSHTQRLLNRSAGIMASQGVNVKMIHALEYDIAFGMEKDLTSHGKKDDWPKIQKMIMDADILVLGTPIWLGVKASVATQVIERMYAYSGDRNDKGQYLYYGKTAGVISTGNEDGAKAVAMDVLYAMSHIGYTVPPQVDATWLGEAGPGPSYGDVPDSSESPEDGRAPAGYGNDFTNRNTTMMAWNLMHAAKMLQDAGGYPTTGNLPEHWREVANATEMDPEKKPGT